MTSRNFLSAHRIFLAGAAISVGLASPGLAAPKAHAHHACHPGGKVSTLSVSGQGEARVAPDMASIRLGVSTTAGSAAEAMAQTSQQQAAVIEALKAANIEAKDIQTSGLDLSPQLNYEDGKAPQVTGYRASNTVSVRVRDLAGLGDVLDAIVAAGANEINGIAFTREDGADAEDDARRAAVADARHKAEVLAEAAGLTLGPVLSLREGGASPVPQPMMMAADAAPRAKGVPIEAGELSMSAEVQIDYALRPADCAGMNHHDGAKKGKDQGAAGMPGKPGGNDADTAEDETAGDQVAEDGADAPDTGN